MVTPGAKKSVTRERGRACVVVCSRHRNRRQDRSGAGHEDQPETQAQDEAASLVGVTRHAPAGRKAAL